MDRKSIFVVATCVILLVVWQFVIVPKYWPYKPPPAQTASATNTPSTTITTNGGTNAIHITATNLNTLQQQIEDAVLTNGGAPRLFVNTNTPEELIVVTNENAR